MGRRLILGTKPEIDPLEEISGSRTTITTGNEIRWESREIGRPMARLLFVSFLAIVISYAMPEIILAVSAITLMLQFITPKLREINDLAHLLQNSWIEVPKGDVSYAVEEDSLIVKGIRNRNHAIGLILDRASPALLGNVSSLVRAIDTSNGFSLTVAMRPEKINRVMDEEKISNMLEGYLTALSKGELDAYLARRSGLWTAHATIVGHVHEKSEIDAFESGVRAGVPEKGWERMEPDALRTKVLQQLVGEQNDSFYAAGSELTEWLVQIRSELAAEVGSNIPGQFIAPIRGRPDDYRLGVTINPDTLQTGPPAGLSHRDLETGTLLCGGTENARHHVLALLASELITQGKRVIVVTGSPALPNLTAITEGSVYLRLGRDLVLNPIDAEGVPRAEYVPLLISALQVVAAHDLRGAADLEMAVSRAISLGNATLADVRLNSEFEDPNTMTQESNTREQRPSRKSLVGLEAIQSLHSGPAARAFYGTQTVPTRRLADPPLTTVEVSLGSTGLDSFAWNLMCMKLAGLKPDSDLVILLDGAENMRIRNRRFMKHDSFSERLLRNLIRRGPLILSLEHPADMAPGAIGVLASCVSLRLRESVDIKYASDLLGLNVITTGMHTKARISPRESSFLRIMDNDTALLVHDGTETCQPVKLDPFPELRNQSAEEMPHRIDQLAPQVSQNQSVQEHTLLDRIAGNDRELAVRVLKLLERYEPLTEEAVRRFVIANGSEPNSDVEGVLARLEHSSMILRGHETHSGVTYSNYRITMKGSMALKQVCEVNKDR